MLKEVDGDIWKLQGDKWVVVPINGYVRQDGKLTMGAGMARTFVDRYSSEDIQEQLGKAVSVVGLQVYVNPHLRVFAFPSKIHWQDDASLELIKESATQIKLMAEALDLDKGSILMPRVGCGNGKLEWAAVKPLLEATLDDRFVIVNKPKMGGKKWRSPAHSSPLSYP